MIIVVTGGCLAWEALTGLIDKAQTDALPPAFVERGLPEPLWIDLRSLRTADPSDPGYQAAVVDIAATLQARSKDDLVGEQVRQHRNRRRSILVAAATLVLVTVTAVLMAWLAVSQRDRADQQSRVATARQLLAQADSALAGDPRTALRLGVAARRFYDGGEVRSWLDSALSGTPFAGKLPGLPGRDAADGGVAAVAFSPDDRTLAVSYQGQVFLWDLTDRRGARRLEGPLPSSAGAVGLAYSNDGRLLLAAADQGRGLAAVWDLTDRERPRLVSSPPLPRVTDPIARGVSSFSAGASVLATSSEGAGVQLWDLDDPAEPRPVGTPLPFEASVESLAFSPDNRVLAVVGKTDYPVQLWDVTDLTRPSRLGRPPVAADVDPGLDTGFGSSAFSPDGRTLAIGESRRGVRLLDVSDPRAPTVVGQPIPDGDSFYRVAFAPRTGRLITSSFSARDTVVWDLTEPRSSYRTAVLPGTGGSETAVSADGTTVAFGGLGVSQGDVELDTLVGHGRPSEPSIPLPPHANGGLIRFAPDSQTVAVGGPGGLALWTAQSAGSPTVLGSTALGPLSDVVGMAWSPDGRVLAVAGRYDGPDNAAVLLDVSDRRRPTVIGRPLYGLAPGGDQQLTFSADGSTLATSGSPSKAFDVRDPGNPRPIARLPNTDYALWISRTDEGRLLAVLSGAEAGNSEPSALSGVRLFDITGAPRQLGPPLGGLSDQVGDVALTASGRRLVTSQPGEVVVWDLTDPAHPARLGRPLEPAGGDIDVALDVDGRTLATVGVGGSVLLWSLDQPERPRQLGRPFSGVDDGYWSVGFSPDGRILAAEGRNGVSMWDLRPLVDLRAHAVEQACRLGNGGLDPEEWVQYLPDRDYVDTCWS